MHQPDGRDLDQAVAAMVRVLTPHASRDWQTRAGSLDWSCWTTVAHVAHDLLAYAGQVAGRPADAYLPFDLVVDPDAPPREVLRVAVAAGRLLVDALAAAGPDVRAWHWGPTDPGGFAALGVEEVLVHTHDVTQGFGVDWRPPEALCAAVLARLFPDAPEGHPVDVLLWCTGRAALGDRPRRTSWTLDASVDDGRPATEGRAKVVTLCGSTRFEAAFAEVQERLTLEGCVVLGPGTFHLPESPDDAGLLRRLGDLHLQKVRMADEVYVVDPGGYVGDSTRREIACAESLGTPVRHLSRETRPG